MLRFAALILPALIAAPAAAQNWQVDHDDSSVGFETTVSGGAVGFPSHPAWWLSFHKLVSTNYGLVRRGGGVSARPGPVAWFPQIKN